MTVTMRMRRLMIMTTTLRMRRMMVMMMMT